MPNISASDYTTFLKYKAAAASPIRPDVQTRTNATLSQSVLNANILASQAAFLATPYTAWPFTIPTTVSAVSSQTVTAARTDIITGSAVTATTTVITYTTSQAHGLSNGNLVTISGLSGAVTPSPNVTARPVTVTGTTTFTVTAASAGAGFAAGAVSGTGSITGRVYYTTSVAHGLSAGQVVSITGVTTFSESNATVLASPTATTFVLSSTDTGTAVSGQTGTIVGFIYYTTAAAHGLSLTRSDQFVTISGITGVTAFNVSSGGSIINIPSSTVFVLAGSTIGAATSQTGIVTVTTIINPSVSIRGNVRVQAPPPNNVNNPNALSTLSWVSGKSGSVGSTTSSKFAQPGGLPANNVVGTYTRLPTNAGWIQGNMISSGPKRF
jgi:hypothetical protein